MIIIANEDLAFRRKNIVQPYTIVTLCLKLGTIGLLYNKYEDLNIPSYFTDSF